MEVGWLERQQLVSEGGQCLSGHFLVAERRLSINQVSFHKFSVGNDPASQQGDMWSSKPSCVLWS